MDILKPRCPRCDWPLAETMEQGCVPGNCCYRPDEGSPEWHRLQARLRNQKHEQHPNVQTASEIADVLVATGMG